MSLLILDAQVIDAELDDGSRRSVRVAVSVLDSLGQWVLGLTKAHFIVTPIFGSPGSGPFLHSVSAQGASTYIVSIRNTKTKAWRTSVHIFNIEARTPSFDVGQVLVKFTVT